ncbi:hypothetical protein [Alistipes sp.]|uniref:hypothetical protein n=1 Tax=Alistipes sp. TaxID=1872444 RepID=UPI0025C2E8C8|nr:hypothetical protein [Alistipes sp.]
MKRFFIAGAAILLATAAVTGIAAYGKAGGSELLDANIEALTGGEVTVHQPCVDFPMLCYILADDLGYTRIDGYTY